MAQDDEVKTFDIQGQRDVVNGGDDDVVRAYTTLGLIIEDLQLEVKGDTNKYEKKC